MTGDTFFAAKNLSAGYGNGDVVKNISFELQPHTLTGLLGANGCGKTTLIRCVVNQLKHRGKCYLNGACLEEKTVRELAREVSYVSQKSHLAISLPVIDVVLMGLNPVLRMLEYPSREQKQRAVDALVNVGLGEYVHQDYLTLSEGQKQLVILARTMIEDTSFLVLDEPDSALDFQNRYLMLKQLKNIVVTGEKAGLLCLHDPALALEICDQILLMKEGKCVHLLRPKTDSISDLERAFQDIYEGVTLTECFDGKGKRHLTLLWEEL